MRVAAALPLLVVMALALGPRLGWYRPATVLSGSMAPGIPVGAVVMDTPIARREVRVGDVITYQIPVGDHHVITHRVVAVLQPGDHPVIQTKGDANAAPDPWQARFTDGPAWRVRLTVPYLGYVLAWLRSPLVHVLTMVVAPLMAAVIVLGKIWGAPGRRSVGGAVRRPSARDRASANA